MLTEGKTPLISKMRDGMDWIDSIAPLDQMFLAKSELEFPYSDLYSVNPLSAPQADERKEISSARAVGFAKKKEKSAAGQQSPIKSHFILLNSIRIYIFITSCKTLSLSIISLQRRIKNLSHVFPLVSNN